MTKIGDPTYEALVEAGRKARERADDMQWVEGDLALDVEALPLDERPRDPETGLFIEDETKALNRYARDVDINPTSLKEYRRVADAWPTTRRLAVVSWGAHQALAAQDDRFELLHSKITTAEARRIVRERTVGARGKPGWLELLGKSADQMIAAGKTLTKLEAEIEARGTKAKVTQKMASKAQRYRAIALDLADRYQAIEET